MALITCKECSSEVSSNANTCPKCGVRVKPASKVWMWVIGVPIVSFAAVVVFGMNTPGYEAKQRDRQQFAVCMADLNDPLKDQYAKNTIIRPVCERLRNEFRAKHNAEP